MRSVRWMIVAALAVPMLAFAQAPGLSGLITQVGASGVTLTLGTQQNVQVGQEFYVYEKQTLVGKVRVIQADANTSQAIVISTAPNQSITQGDEVDSSPLQASMPQPAPQAAPAAPPLITADPTKQYTDLLKHRTQSYLFKIGPATNTGPKVPVLGLMNLLSTTSVFTGGGGSSYISPWIVGDMAYTAYSTHELAKRSTQMTHDQIDIIYWDEALLNAYTDYYCYKDAPADAARQAQIRQSMQSQRGVDRAIAFQVRISNRGPLPLQLAPFNWHIYLVDQNGNRVKAVRYDEALDKGMNQGQSATGYVYFPKFDAAGNPLIAPGAPVKLALEDILGDRASVTFKP